MSYPYTYYVEVRTVYLCMRLLDRLLRARNCVRKMAMRFSVVATLAIPSFGLRASQCAPAIEPCRMIPSKSVRVNSNQVAMLTSEAGMLIAGTTLGGTLGTPFVVGAIKTWYREINLPTWTPPDRVFAPVWTCLYAMMGLATAQVGKTLGFSAVPVLHFATHYIINIAWAPIFFGAQCLRLALGINVWLICSLSVLIKQYAMVDTFAGALLLPYMAWLLFATWLNAAICRMNPTVQGYNNARWRADVVRLRRRALRLASA